VDATKFNQIDLAGLEHNDNITEVHLRWLLGPSVKEVLPMLKRCTHLRRLTLERPARICFPPFEELCNFIMELKQLTCLQIIYDHCHRSNHFKSEVDEVNAFLLPLRPNFNFCLSCCSKSGKSRVSRTTTL